MADQYELPHILIAAFCTAEIPTEMLDKFLTLSFARSTTAGMAPRLLDQPGQKFHDHIGVSRPPTAPFHSDYLGLSISALARIFEDMVGEKEGNTHANCVFLVLDSQTLEDETVCGVSTLGELQTLRADFSMSICILGAAEINLELLDEGAFGDFYKRGDIVTVEGWERQEEEWRREEEEKQERRRSEKTKAGQK